MKRQLRKLFFSLGLSVIAFNAWAQEKTEMFTDLESFKNINPEISENVLIERRTQHQIFMTGGNDYKLTPKEKDRTLKKKLKKELWGLKHQDSLFINCYHLKIGFWYAYAQKAKNRLFFKAALTMNKEQQRKLGMTAYALGPIGGGISSGKFAQLRAFYTMDLETGKSIYLTKDEFLRIIEDYQDLLAEYSNEEDPEDVNTLQNYITRYIELIGE